jgi:hypothetical protein
MGRRENRVYDYQALPSSPACSIRAVTLLASVLTACGGAARSEPRVAVPRAACGAGTLWNGVACQGRSDAAALLAEGTAALGNFHVDEAMAQLERARALGPHAHDDLAALYAQLGIGHAYLDHEAEASAAFDMLLAIDPGYLLSYTLSPKATFLFERARNAARKQTPPAIDVSWPRQLDVSRPVPVDIEVVADPKQFLRRAVLHMRRRGEVDYASFDVALVSEGSFARVVLPAPATHRAEVLQLWATGLDDAGNEVLVWAGADFPREVPLHFDPPPRWYRKWWVWAIVGGVVAAGTSTTVYLLSREPPTEVDGSVEVAQTMGQDRAWMKFIVTRPWP